MCDWIGNQQVNKSFMGVISNAGITQQLNQMIKYVLTVQ